MSAVDKSGVMSIRHPLILALLALLLGLELDAGCFDASLPLSPGDFATLDSECEFDGDEFQPSQVFCAPDGPVGVTSLRESRPSRVVATAHRRVYSTAVPSRAPPLLTRL